MTKSFQQKLIRCIILLIGLIIAHFGVTLYLLVDLGADPFNVLVQGVFRRLEVVINNPLITHGNVHIVISLMIIVTLLIVDRSYIKIGTILCMVFGGPIIDFFTNILAPLFETSYELWIKILFEIIACVILALGMSIVIKSDAGTGPNDLVAVVISDKIHKKFSIVRMLTDVTFVIIGFLLGGVWGIGTIICAFLVGPVAGFFLPHSERIVKRIVKDIQLILFENMAD